ncbi:MAG TPA: NAD(P)-dependent oxidoreductase [Lachnospiraceae bacterium]|nr:NAD(P)-dependent oxidoreductase [Lachnospiraceae bacterium]
MKIAFYSTKPYDRIWFEPMAKEYGYTIEFIDLPFAENTIFLARGYDAVCIFVNDETNAKMIEQLVEIGVKAILLRSAGFNHVDMKAAKDQIKVLRVPAYSPDSVAEFAMGLLLACNRMIHKAYGRTRDFNMNINGFLGTDFCHKNAGVIGTGKIGQAMIRILKGFSMNVLAFDPYPVKGLDVEYVSLEELFEHSA